MSGFWSIVLMILLLVTSLFLILLVLVQRGKGGGLAGALGGMGGQSAFGTKAGDLFTKITVGIATFWIILCMVITGIVSAPEKTIIDPNLGTKSQPREGIGAPPDAPGGTSDEETSGGPE